jgi:hypothetical protein
LKGVKSVLKFFLDDYVVIDRILIEFWGTLSSVLKMIWFIR